MKRKAILAWCAVVVLAFTSFSGCKKETPTNPTGGNSAAVDAQHPITITAFIGDSTTITPTEDNKIFKKIKDELGITFKFDILAGDINQKLGVMIAGGDLPDIVSYNAKFQEAGDLIPLEDKVQKSAPDVYQHYIKGGAWNMMKDSNDGHIYYLPNYGISYEETSGSYYSGPAFWIQKQVLADAGYPKVTTLDQYFDLVKNWVAKHPTTAEGQPTIGFETLATNGQSFVLENAPSQLSGHPNDGGVNVDNGVATLYADKDEAKTYFKKLNDMYNAGIVDKEAVTQTQDQYLQKIASGRVVAMYDQHWDFGSAENTLIKDKKDAETYAPLELVYPGKTPHYKDRPIPNLLNGYSVTKSCKDPDRVLAALNLLMSEKWQKILNWGIQDEDYSIDSASKQPVWTDAQKTNQSDNAWKAKNRADALYGTLFKIEGKYTDGNATSLGDNPIQYQKGLSDYDKTFLKAYNASSFYDMMSKAPKNEISYPCWNINIPANSPASIAGTALEQARLKWYPRVIAAKSADFDSQWNEFVKEFNAANPKDYLDAVNAGIQYRVKNWTVK